MEAANTPILGRKVVKIAYLLILRTGVMKNPASIGKTCRLNKKSVRISRKISTSLQVLSDMQEVNSGSIWIWRVRNSYTGNRNPSHDCV